MHYLSNFHDLLSNIYRDVTCFALYLCLPIWQAAALLKRLVSFERVSNLEALTTDLSIPWENWAFFWGGHWIICHGFCWDYAHMIFIFFVYLQRLDTLMIIWSLKLGVIYWDLFLTCDPLFHKRSHNLRSVGYSDTPSPVTRLRSRTLHRTNSISE